MQAHLTIDRRSKDKLTAQQVGIRAAQESFKISLKTRTPLFSWDDEPVTLSIVLNELHMQYAKIISDMSDLRDIVRTSCLIEYSNLKEQYKKPLPISTFNDEQIVHFFVDAATYELLKERKKSNFSNFLQNFNAFEHMVLTEVIEQSYPVDDLKRQAFNTLDRLFEKNTVSLELQEKIKKAVDNFLEKL